MKKNCLNKKKTNINSKYKKGSFDPQLISLSQFLIDMQIMPYNA